MHSIRSCSTPRNSSTGSQPFVFLKLSASGQLDLVFKIKLIALSTGESMQMISHLPDKFQCLNQFIVFNMGKISVILKIPALPDIRCHTGQPEHGMVIPKPPLALFYIGLEQIGAIPEPLVPVLIALDKPACKPAGRFWK